MKTAITGTSSLDNSKSNLLPSSTFPKDPNLTGTQLTPEELEAITRESRALFLNEEAPEHLAVLEQGVSQLRAGEDLSDRQEEYSALIRAAHSLKGGAGMSQLPALSKLAHILEDLLIYLFQSGLPVGLAPNTSQPTGTVGLKQEAENIAQIPDFVKTALSVDLENCLQRVEGLLSPPGAPAGEEHQAGGLQEALTTLAQECALLGQALSLPWLAQEAVALREALGGANRPLEGLAAAALAQLRQRREQFLEGEPSVPAPPVPEGSPQLSPTEKEVGENGGAQETAQSLPKIPERFLKYVVADRGNPASAEALNLRVPVAVMDRIGDTVGELFIYCERLALYQAQLEQASRNLKTHTQRLDPILERVWLFEHRHPSEVAPAFAQLPVVSRSAVPPEWEILLERESRSVLEKNNSKQLNGNGFSHGREFEEVLVQVRETRSDVGAIARELKETLDRLRASLNSLHEDLTESRLVPFGLQAGRFKASLLSLNQKYNKQVELVVEGRDTLVDQAVLEQLQAPLTQLFRNAFDHGIELPSERQALGKPKVGRITLSAAVSGNRAVISIADDGRGIDPQKVYQRAVEMGLADKLASQLKVENSELSQGEILQFLFAPGFSTAARVSDLSGRGVGLDIVRHQIGRLRGEVRVETALGEGTKFAISIPVTQSVLPLLVCRCGQQTLAIPSINVLEVISLSESSLTAAGSVLWREQLVPVFPLVELLPYKRADIVPAAPALQPPVGIVADVSGEPVVLAADALLLQRELVLKPFDGTVPVPAYLAGCTVLATGEVVPVLSPNHLGELIVGRGAATQKSEVKSGKLEFIHPADNISEPALFPPDSTPSILIVDDSIAVRRSLELLLSRAGFAVVQCRDGKEALQELHYSGRRFDLVISDIEMPRMDGFGLLAEIRAHPSTSQLPVVIVTTRESAGRHACTVGATAYFTKPFAPAQLLDAIVQLLAGRVA
ncbi:MAG: hybrid sensor histidine kinase/response regulator [Oscillatoria princeps RMCB-10]|nr:hybrid sensor histidine kinase/response regulator [Oscillatoria princeps RMCB-10]